MTTFSQLAGLPPYGDLAITFPADWARFGREGLVVQFTRSNGSEWVGNFAPGFGRLSEVRQHPDDRRVLVLARGRLWLIDPDEQTGTVLSQAVDAILEIPGSKDLILDIQGLAFARVAGAGVAWHTKRLSWDGFDAVRVEGGRLVGLAWNPLADEWNPFEVDLSTGASSGGSFGESDAEDWERLAPLPLLP
jgi:hypothetical protein